MFCYKGIPDYHQQLRTQSITCSEVVEHYLNQISNKNHLNAFVSVFSESARARARQLDQHRAKGEPMKSLHGVVIGIKDVICYEGHVVSAASKMLEGFESLYTASALKFLIEEEAIIIGSCNCDEFAMGSSNENSYYGPVINGIGNNMVPGGSSGGSAVAVQTGQCMVSLGSDTGGSVRQPADFCGIIGFKPGYGMVSRYGLIAYASSFDQIGIFATSIEDLEQVFGVISKPDKMDTTMNQTPQSTPELSEKPAFGYFREMLEHNSLDPEIRAAIKTKIKELENSGHSIKVFDFPLIDYIVPAYYVLTTAEASSNLSRYDGIRYGYREEANGVDLTRFYKRNRSRGFGKEVKKRIMLGSFVLSAGYYDAYYQKAQQVRRILKDHIEQVFREVDFMLLPNAPTTAYPIGSRAKDPLSVYLADIFTVYANLVAVPAIAVPGFKHSNNMPFGLQIITRRGDDVNLLRISKSVL
jgi:aspartyl-tRNA(Asn)/glutamyl-tRNA(Gln) amidotransferase subunit A